MASTPVSKTSRTSSSTTNVVQRATLTTNGPGGAAGSFTITGLPVPSSCTVTFTSDGYQTETYAAAFTTAGLVGVGPVTMLPVEAAIEGM